ncbi:MAG: hypothetical protein H8D47_04260 [Planctomycetes bacterium]|nr:hypothetical protein [Planctomycetota bacterium]
MLKDIGRAEYVEAEDKDVIKVFDLMCRLEGILPALESSHALAYLMKSKGKLSSDTVVVANLSGRGDKDVGIIESYRKVTKG